MCEIFHCFEHNLECLNVDSAGRVTFYVIREKNMAGNMNHGSSISDRMKFNSIKYGLQRKVHQQNMERL